LLQVVHHRIKHSMAAWQAIAAHATAAAMFLACLLAWAPFVQALSTASSFVATPEGLPALAMVLLVLAGTAKLAHAARAASSTKVGPEPSGWLLSGLSQRVPASAHSHDQGSLAAVAAVHPLQAPVTDGSGSSPGMMRIPMTGYDAALREANLTYTVQFEGRLDAAALRAGLAKAMQANPLLAGRITRESDGTRTLHAPLPGSLGTPLFPFATREAAGPCPHVQVRVAARRSAWPAWVLLLLNNSHRARFSGTLPAARAWHADTPLPPSAHSQVMSAIRAAGCLHPMGASLAFATATYFPCDNRSLLVFCWRHQLMDFPSAFGFLHSWLSCAAAHGCDAAANLAVSTAAKGACSPQSDAAGAADKLTPGSKVGQRFMRLPFHAAPASEASAEGLWPPAVEADSSSSRLASRAWLQQHKASCPFPVSCSSSWRQSVLACTPHTGHSPWHPPTDVLWPACLADPMCVSVTRWMALVTWG
jgi:hypothetical protein